MRPSLVALISVLYLAYPSPTPPPFSSAPSYLIPSSPTDHRRELRELQNHLQNTLIDLEYQMEQVFIPLFHYGMLHPKKVRATVTCFQTTCDFNLTFNGAATALPDAEDYENAHQNFLALYKRAETLGLPPLYELACPDNLDFDDPSPICTRTDALPRLVALDGALILSITRPRYDCTQQIIPTGFAYAPSKNTLLTVFFPSCKTFPPKTSDLYAGYTVTGPRVKDLYPELSSDGIYLAFNNPSEPQIKK